MCNRFIPVFDQPDLKATIKFNVTAPIGWKIIATEPLGMCTECKVNEGYMVWDFGETLKLSSYLFTIIAGPFKEIECPADKLHKNITMKIYCRETLFKYAEKQQVDVFEFNSDAIRRYEELFGYDYPFRKCDTIFCPEYRTGAMENPGAITYTENYLYKKDPSTGEISDRATTIIHELAHMRFGD